MSLPYLQSTKLQFTNLHIKFAKKKHCEYQEKLTGLKDNVNIYPQIFQCIPSLHHPLYASVGAVLCCKRSIGFQNNRKGPF